MQFWTKSLSKYRLNYNSNLPNVEYFENVYKTHVNYQNCVFKEQTYKNSFKCKLHDVNYFLKWYKTSNN